jgi:hypothetical protein
MNFLPILVAFFANDWLRAFGAVSRLIFGMVVYIAVWLAVVLVISAFRRELQDVVRLMAESTLGLSKHAGRNSEFAQRSDCSDRVVGKM